MKKLLAIILCGVVGLGGYVALGGDVEPTKTPTLAEQNNSGCAVHGLCTYDGIEYSKLIKNSVPVENYPKTKAEFDMVKSTLE